jgi:acetylornithine deacetylase/succinyl-diaminopimelate desuccinylase-like protein
MTAWQAHLDAHEPQYFDELIEFLRIPSISTDPSRKADTAAAAQWVADRLKAAGVPEVELVQTPGHPVVSASWLVDPSKPRVLIYGHYDVQPPEPLELWETPPFEPTIRDGRVYARGAGDMKANLLSVIHAVETFAKTAGHPPLNLLFLFEGEEEIGSPNLPAYVEAAKDKLAADVVLNADGGVSGPNLPSLTVALKGLGGCQIDIKTGESDLHSGMYGATVPNANQVAVQLAATFHNDDGSVAVDGFYDKVIPLTEQDRADIAKAAAEKGSVLEDSRAFALWGEAGYTETERIFARPTLDINGMWGGFTGEGSKTVTPCEAHIKITCRLVPDQDPIEIVDLIRAHVEKHILPGVKFEVNRLQGLAYPYALSRDLPALQKASAVMTELYGREPIYVRAGGSVPITSVFKNVLGAESVAFAFAQSGSNAHAPNEWFRVEDFALGHKGNYLFLEALASGVK